MKKKRYLKPTVKVYDIKQPTVLLGGSPTEFGQLPTIPGGGENRTWGQESCEKNQLA